MSDDAAGAKAERKRAELVALVAPGHTALVTVEVQEGVVGDGAVLPDLAVAAAPVLPNVATMVRAARAAGAHVVHCTVEQRLDGRGANLNTPLLAAMAGRGGPPRDEPGVRAATVHPAIGPGPNDLVMSRMHGMSPMTGTELDAVLRNMGVTTIVATGVSVNVAVLGFAFEAVNHGYRLVIPRDGVAGVDEAYVEAVFVRTLRMLATVTTTEALVGIWEASS